MKLIAALLLFITPLQAEFTVHYMWGLWDNFPLPEKYQKIQKENKRALKAPLVLHQREDIFAHVKQFSDEFGPEFFELFTRIPRKVCQADLGRYILIYHLGGLYLDLDARVKNAKKFLEDLDYYNGVWLTEKMAPVESLGPREKPYTQRVAQYAFYVSQPRSPLLLEIIKEAFNRVNVLFQERGNAWSDSDVLWATGPDVVTTCIHETSERHFKLLSLSKSNAFVIHECHWSWHDGKDKN